MATNRKQRTNSSKKKKKSVSTSTVSKKSNKQKQKEADFARFHSEIVILLSVVCMIFLLLSNFSLCGTLGSTISDFFFGIFGWIQYILPILSFLGLAFLISNDFSSLAIKKILLLILSILDITALLQMFTAISFHDPMTAYGYAKHHHVGGGYVGEWIYGLFVDNLGTVGSFLVLIAFLIIFSVLITERSFLAVVKRSSGKVAENIKEQKKKASIRLEEKHKRREIEKQNKIKRQASNIQLTEQVQPTKDDAPSITQTDKSIQKETSSSIMHPEIKSSNEEKILLQTNVPSGMVEQKQEEIFHFMENEELNDKNTKSDNSLLNEQIYTIHSNEEEEPQTPSGSWDLDSLPTEEEYLLNTTKWKQDDVDITMSNETEDFLELHAEETIHNSDNLNDIPNPTSETKSMQVIKRLTNQSVSKAEPTNEELLDVPMQSTKKSYELPPIELLNAGTKNKNADNGAELRETALKLQKTLENFGVGVTITDVSQGPAVTRYELQPEQGVKVSKIVGLADDIKLNLAAADIRIEAPIPGKAAIGIEVPNKTNTMVTFRELIENEEFRKYPSDIAFAVGKDIGGKTIVTDIGKMPHLLIAGATGSGKSVCINTLIMSILYKAKPEDVKLIMIDPKVVELSTYNGIPHLLIPVVTDPKKASGALNWAVSEMTERYKKFAEVNVRNLKGYNTKVEEVLAMEGSRENSDLQKLPQIVIIVDELADLMMVAPGEVEDAIVRLSQLARAAGIHLVIATQRPSVNVITGLIKANVPSRIAFSVSSGVDSRTILDMNGAEKLLGKGDMLFYPSGYQKPVRVQGAFISDQEVTKVVDFLKGQQLEVPSTIQEEIEEKINTGILQDTTVNSDRDEYFEEAGRFVIEKEKASIGMLQRMFKIGFNRAARIMEQLQEAGVVGSEEGTKPRKVLMSLPEFEEQLNQVES